MLSQKLVTPFDPVAALIVKGYAKEGIPKTRAGKSKYKDVRCSITYDSDMFINRIAR